MNVEEKKRIRFWINNRFGVPNTFNAQLLFDFLIWARKELPEQKSDTPEILGTDENRLDN